VKERIKNIQSRLAASASLCMAAYLLRSLFLSGKVCKLKYFKGVMLVFSWWENVELNVVEVRMKWECQKIR